MRFGGPAGLNGHAARRHLVDYGNVQITIERERKRTRNRSGRHYQDIGRSGLVHQLLALQNAEAVLLVHNHEPQPREFNLRLEQRVRPGNKL